MNTIASAECPTTPRIVGGMFGLGEVYTTKTSTPPFLKGQAVLLVNVSSGIWLLTKLLSPAHVWMPSYLCEAMVKAVDQSTTTLKFYEVDYDLRVPALDWLENVRSGDLVVLIDYFGFPSDKECSIQAKAQGAWVLKDASQALLNNHIGQSADFVLFSPRKFLGVPDGGVLILNEKISFDDIRLEGPPSDWWLKALQATILRREFDLNGGNRRWVELFQQIEAEAPIGPYTMSEFSEMLLRHSFDYELIARRRVENYQHLARALGHLALYPKLPAQVVPLGFPMRVQNRDRLRQILFDQEIYPPVHWPIQDVVSEKFIESHRLSAEIMTLPCDQRYDIRDMERMAEAVRKGDG